MVSITPRRSARPGFTLMELAIIIAIVGILAAVGAVKYADMVTQAKEAGKSAAMANCRSALAIAIAKDTDGKVAFAELQTYLAGATSMTGAVMTLKDSAAGATTYSVTCDGDNTNIKGILSIN